MKAELVLTFFALLNFASAIETEYYGVKLGKLKNVTHGISGFIYYANETLLQIVDFNIDSLPDLELRFFFSDAESSHPASGLYQVFKKGSVEAGFSHARLLVGIPKLPETTWTHFGIATQKSWKYLAALKLKKQPPKPFCCISNPLSTSRGIIGKHYQVGTAPIVVLDSQTILLPSFSFKGTSPPDGWVYAGVGKTIDQNTGLKAMVLGRDTPERHCGLHEDYDGTKDLVARLHPSQTIYNIDFIAIFCYQYSVDFGHLRVNLDPERQPVPAWIPPISETPLPKLPPSPHC
uniref:DM13 domain-containing protein n=1 Tax=Panagrolaimus sp. PS1159 TaxID=55785 RepID=A0AC35GU54_9BILA